MKKWCSVILCAAMLAVLLAGCGANSKPADVAGGAVAYSADMAYDREMPMEEKMMVAEESQSAMQPAKTEQKLIYNADLQLQTMQFDEAVQSITALTEQLGGYIENRSISDGNGGYRYAGFTVRVPSAQFNAFCDLAAGTLCHVAYCNTSVSDISEMYYDTDERLETARIKLARLQELLHQAKDMSDIITIESAITETEYQIESLAGTLRHYDAQVDNSTVYVNLQEVYQFTNTESGALTFPQRIGNAFRSGMKATGNAIEAFIVWIVYSWVALVALAAVVFVVIRAIRCKKRGERFFPSKKK